MEEGSFEIAAFYFGKKQALCVPAAARAQGRLVPAWRSFHLCAHTHSWESSCWLRGFLDQVLEISGSEKREWSWLTPSLMCVEWAVLLPALGLTCLSPDIAESSLVWWSASCCWTLDLGKTSWLCLSPRVETGALKHCWAVPLPAAWLSPGLVFYWASITSLLWCVFP